MVTQHYRWDFIGLSSYDKPTPETSEKVVDGSTYYEADTSKLYVFYKDTWYEKTATGGGGGSDITVVQTTGDSTTDVMSQKAVTDALATVSDIKTLTAADYNYPANNPSRIAHWLLDPGVYIVGGESGVRFAYSSISSGTEYPDTLLIISRSGAGAFSEMLIGHNGTWANYGAQANNGAPYNAKTGEVLTDARIKQTTGTSTTDVMSQKAVTDALANAVTVNQVNATIDAINTALSTNIPHIGA